MAGDRDHHLPQLLLFFEFIFDLFLFFGDTIPALLNLYSYFISDPRQKNRKKAYKDNLKKNI